jgi:hypothetical protein
MLQRIASTVALVAVLVFAGAAFASNGAGPTKPSSSTISAPIVVSATASSATASGPRFGDTITFNVSTTQTGNPFVNLVCTGDGVGYNSWAAFWPTAGSFVLSSGGWTGGAADCTAKLVMYVTSSKYKVLASTSFHVDA